MNRAVEQTTLGQHASDGAGVKMKRYIGSPELDMVDPFLMLDWFHTDAPQDYLAGFPNHPHRGFETVTIMLDGRMRHKDNKGNEGVIEPGGIQWMRAASGIIHSEMPEQENGLMSGFQLWVNLPAKDKMQAPTYKDVTSGDVPVEQREGGVEVRVLFGDTSFKAQSALDKNATQTQILNVHVPQGQKFSEPMPKQRNGFVMVHEGVIAIEGQVLEKGSLGVLGAGDRIEAIANGDAKFLFVSALPLNEPVVKGGPFVMNTRQEILQAFEDFHQGRF